MQPTVEAQGVAKASKYGGKGVCNICLGSEGHYPVCWGCGYRFHWECLGFEKDPGGPLYCDACRHEYRLAGVKDLTLDVDLMSAVACGCPTNAPQRIKRASAWFC